MALLAGTDTHRGGITVWIPTHYSCVIYYEMGERQAEAMS